jgi:hypothetical protein
LRVGIRDGNHSDRVASPLAIKECLALGVEGGHGIVADSKADSRRTLGLCLEQGIGLVTLVPCIRRSKPGAETIRVAPLGGETGADAGGWATLLAWAKRHSAGGGGVQ